MESLLPGPVFGSRIQKGKIMKKKFPQKKYYEIELDHDPRSRECTDELIGECSICIIGTRKPTYEEAEAFCREEMVAAGYEYIVAIREINHEDALGYIRAADEQKLPIFGLQI